jgi:LacI family transcriptional regulator
LLALLMKGHPAPEPMQYIPPLGVVTRQSTDVTAIQDPRVASAMCFIREHACEGIGVEDVLDHVLVSRSVLQHLFRQVLDKTILSAITDARLHRVKQLLVETSMPLTAIAQRTGFSYDSYLSSLFKQKTGRTPSSYRRDFASKRFSGGP